MTGDKEMTGDKDDSVGAGVSRRDLLIQVGLAGAAVAIPLHVRAIESSGLQVTRSGTSVEQAFQTLTAEEGALLEAVVARIIPTDANGPGAAEARAARYIDRALTGALANSRKAYAVGLTALERYARSSRRAPFVELSAIDQESVLIDVETGSATGFTEPTAAAFFTMVRAHTMQGTFGDPFYGGNANFVGWDLLGYPGLRLAVTADEQRLGAKLAPTHRSAYDHEMFVKGVARHTAPPGRSHADGD
jgi:gluconate 2-dehydrogenase gamma chain